MINLVEAIKSGRLSEFIAEQESNGVEKISKNQFDAIVKKAVKEREYSHNVPRASLTYEIDNKEPVGEIAQTVTLSKKKPRWIYYFTELSSMNGRKVYHEWLKNGVIVSRQELVISGDTWRTSSRKLLSGSDKGKWAVRMIDENGRLLNEKYFKVE